MWSSDQLPYLISPILKPSGMGLISLHFLLAKLPIKINLAILTTPEKGTPVEDSFNRQIAS